MPRFTIEATYRLPVFCHRTVEAPTLEAAIQSVLDDEDWSDPRDDYASAGPTYITGAWEGDEAYNGPDLDIPSQFPTEG